MRVTVRVKPNSQRPRIEVAADGSLLAHLKSPPVEGRANAELTKALARHFGVAISRVQIRTGATARIKLVEIV